MTIRAFDYLRRKMRIAGAVTGPTLQDSVDTVESQDAFKQLVLSAETTLNQEPVALDTPIDVNYGAAVGTPSDPVMVDANGVITYNQAGTYESIVTLQIGRTGSAGTAWIFTRVAIDPGSGSFVVFSEPQLTKIPSATMVFPERLDAFSVLPAGARAKVQLGRDSTGTDDGGLIDGPPLA